MPKGIFKRKPFTEEHRRKLSENHEGQTPWNKGTRGIMKAWNKGLKGLIGNRKGKKCSDEHKRKLSVARRDLIKTGWKSPMTGKHHSETARHKMSLAQIGERSHRWLGGKSFENYTTSWTKQLRKFIRKRDVHTCQMCLKEGFEVHHIDYNKKNCSEDNLITLCKSCHSKTNFNRQEWIRYFANNYCLI